MNIAQLESKIIEQEKQIGLIKKQVQVLTKLIKLYQKDKQEMNESWVDSMEAVQLMFLQMEQRIKILEGGKPDDVQTDNIN